MLSEASEFQMYCDDVVISGKTTKSLNIFSQWEKHCDSGNFYVHHNCGFEVAKPNFIYLSVVFKTLRWMCHFVWKENRAAEGTSRNKMDFTQYKWLASWAKLSTSQSLKLSFNWKLFRPDFNNDALNSGLLAQLASNFVTLFIMIFPLVNAHTHTFPFQLESKWAPVLCRMPAIVCCLPQRLDYFHRDSFDVRVLFALTHAITLLSEYCAQKLYIYASCIYRSPDKTV